MLKTPQEIATLVGVALLSAALGGVGGYWLGHHQATAQGDANLAGLRSEYASQLAASIEAARIREQALNIHGNTLTAMLLAETKAHAADAEQSKKEIDRVTTHYRPTPGAALQPAPRCVYTNGFVSLYNSANGAAAGPVPATDAAGSVDAAPDASEALDSGVSQQDVLASVIDNGGRCRDIESQLNRLIDYTEEVAQ